MNALLKDNQVQSFKKDYLNAELRMFLLEYLTRLNIKPHYHKTILAIGQRINQNTLKKGSWPGKKLIARDASCSLKTVKNHMPVIKKIFDVKAEHTFLGDDKPNIYTLKPIIEKQYIKWLNGGGFEAEPPETPNKDRGVMATLGGVNVTPKELIKDKDLNTNYAVDNGDNSKVTENISDIQPDERFSKVRGKIPLLELPEQLERFKKYNAGKEFRDTAHIIQQWKGWVNQYNPRKANNPKYQTNDQAGSQSPQSTEDTARSLHNLKILLMTYPHKQDMDDDLIKRVYAAMKSKQLTGRSLEHAIQKGF